MSAPAGASRRTTRGAWEAAAWAAVVGLLSPLVLYASAGWMPLAALWAVAGGIALGLCLVGVRLHGLLLADALSGRTGTGRVLLAAGMILLAVFLVLAGATVALVLMVRGGAPSLPV